MINKNGMSKKIILLSLLSCFILSYAKSQTFEAGIKAGIAASQISGDGYAGFNKAGIVAGLFSRIEFSDKHHIQFELTYTQKGSRRNPKTSEGDTEFFLLRLNYIEIPILYQFDYKNFTFETGPYVSTLVGTYLEDENGPFKLPSVVNQFKNMDFGLSAGIAFNFSESVVISWRYSNSIVPVRDFNSRENIKTLGIGEGAFNRFNSGMFHSYMSFTLQFKFGEKNG